MLINHGKWNGAEADSWCALKFCSAESPWHVYYTFTSQDEHLIARNGLDFAPCRLKKGTVLKSGPD